MADSPEIMTQDPISVSTGTSVSAAAEAHARP